MYTIFNWFYIILDNIDYYGILILTFIAICSLIFAMYFFIQRHQDKTQRRLDKLVLNKSSLLKVQSSSEKFIGQKKQDSLAAKISKPLHKISSLDKRTVRQKMLLKLVRAGYRSDQAIYNYLAAKILLPIFYVGCFIFFRMVYKFETQTILSVLLLIVLGYFTPTLWVFLMTKTRQEKIFKALPDSLDLMVVCVESGLGVDLTFKRVGEEIRHISKDLSDEFHLTSLEVRAGISREVAFSNMNTRVNLPEVNSLMTILTQTSRFGTSLAKALRIHAEAMRKKRRQIAEETAAKSAVKLIFPLVLFIFPAIFVVLIGPGAIQIIKHLLPALRGGG